MAMSDGESALASKYRISNELAEIVFQASLKFEAARNDLAANSDEPVLKGLHDIYAHVEHFVLDTQLAMISLEACVEGSRMERYAAARVIHTSFELKGATDRWFFRKLRDFAVTYGLKFDFTDIKKARVRFAQDLKVIDGWASVRNFTTGHYDSDAARVAEAIDSIDVGVVRRVADAQLKFLESVMLIVRALWWAEHGGGAKPPRISDLED